VSLIGDKKPPEVAAPDGSKQKADIEMVKNTRSDDRHKRYYSSSGPKDLAYILARSIVLIVVQAQSDWLNGNSVLLSDVRTHVELLLREELALRAERLHGEDGSGEVEGV
jgi:hypothetical protein